MKALDRAVLSKFLKLAGERLSGRWVLIGGTVLPLLDSEIRSTVDIDLVGLPAGSNREALALMQIAEDLGLPVETINQAGAFFLSKIDDFEGSLILLHGGKKAKIYRPNADLFVRLKLDRLSETDLMDCLEFIRISEKLGDRLDRAKLRRRVEADLKRAKVKDRIARLKSMLAALQ